MSVNDIDGYSSREDRIVAEFGDGLAVEGIAFRYGLTVEQVYAVIEREVGPAGQAPPPHYPPAYYGPPPPPPPYYGPPSPQPFGPPAGRPPPTYPDYDAIVAEYGEGHDVHAIAQRHRITAQQVYEVIQRIVDEDGSRP